MKLNSLTKCIAMSLAICSAPTLALDTTAELHGYVKSGLLLTSDGTRGNSVGILKYGKWRLGNEQNTKIELLPTVKMATDEGTWAKFKANLTHETNCTADWNCTDGNDKSIQYREGYVEMGGFDFAQGVTFWAGKRYNTYNTSNHQYDWEYIQYNGTGGGVDNVDVSFAKMDLGFYAFMPSGDNSVDPVDSSKRGYPEDLSFNLIFKEIGGTGLALQATGHTMEESTNRPGSATSGLGLAAAYHFDGFYGFANGYSRVVLQHGEGMAAGDSLGKNGWGFANSEDTKSTRIVFDGLVNLADNVEMSTFAFYQTDSDYAPWSDWSQPTTKGYDREIYAIGVRPHHQITTNFAMQYELGYENSLEKKDGGADGGLVKATIAPTLTLETGFWARPQLRAFVTYAKWDEGVSGLVDAGYTRDGQKDTLNFGVQAELWF